MRPDHQNSAVGLVPPLTMPEFDQPLVDLGVVEHPSLAGVLSPSAEAGTPRQGVNEAFLANAEEYYRKFTGFDYWADKIRIACERIGLTEPHVAIEFGAGFGNASIPFLKRFESCRLIATDISPNMLAILKRLSVDHGVAERCVPVAMDAMKPYVRNDVADFVFGAAVLHHLVEPGKFVARAMEILRPGGSAVFFEPMEGGYALLRMLCLEILREAERRGAANEAEMVVTRKIIDSFTPQIFRRRDPNWEDRDDKWVFPRSTLDRIAVDAGARLSLIPLHDQVAPFRTQFSYLLKTYGGLNPETYPEWAWDVFNTYDRDSFSQEMLTDLCFESCLIFSK